MKRALRWGALVSALGLAAALSLPNVPAAAAPAGSATQIAIAGTSSPQTGAYVPSGDGDVTQAEFPGQLDEAEGRVPIPERSSIAACRPGPGTASR